MGVDINDGETTTIQTKVMWMEKEMNLSVTINTPLEKDLVEYVEHITTVFGMALIGALRYWEKAREVDGLGSTSTLDVLLQNIRETKRTVNLSFRHFHKRLLRNS